LSINVRKRSTEATGGLENQARLKGEKNSAERQRYECGGAKALMCVGPEVGVRVFTGGAGGGNFGAGFAVAGAAETGAFVCVNPCSAASAGGAVSGTSTSTGLVGTIFSRGTTF
jgi:hypothetical protein